MGIAELHSRALDATRRVIAGVHQDQWAAPTPREGWDVRALVNHVVSGNLWAAELAAGKTISEVGDHLDGHVLGADPLGAYDTSAKAAAAAFAIPGALKAPCAVSYGPVPGAVYAGHRFIDVLIHGWDVATATRQDTNLRAVLVDKRIASPRKMMSFTTAPPRSTTSTSSRTVLSPIGRDQPNDASAVNGRVAGSAR
jgi:uncharacterized protein (TIGR03086 family)